jgi:tRNA A37 threonylcarbamoyladenosine synthetase subunit TsaC/SUA5/YrdC
MVTLIFHTLSKSKILSIYLNLKNKEALNSLDIIKDVLKRGGVIAVPTDTIYGVACLACNKDSLAKIYQIKGRSLSKPLAIAVGNVEDLEKYDLINYYLKKIQLET